MSLLYDLALGVLPNRPWKERGGPLESSNLLQCLINPLDQHTGSSARQEQQQKNPGCQKQGLRDPSQLERDATQVEKTNYAREKATAHSWGESYSDIFSPQYLRMELYLKIGLLQIELDGVIPEKGEALTQCEWRCPYKEGKSGDRCIQVETKAEID